MWCMFWCGVYYLYLTYTEMYIVVLSKFSLYYNSLIQWVTEIESNKLFLLLLHDFSPSVLFSYRFRKNFC